MGAFGTFADSVANLSRGPANCTSSPSHVNTGYFVTEVLTAFFAVLGNVFICFAVARDRKLRTATNYFLVSLAVADMLVGAVAIPCALLSHLGLPRCDYRLCVLVLCALLVLTQASILGQLAVAAERYVAVLWPFRYRAWLTPGKAGLTIATSWVLAVGIGLVPLMGWRKAAPGVGQACLFKAVIDEGYMVYFNFIGCMLLPLLLMFVIYARIFLEVKRQIHGTAKRCIGISVEEKRRLIIRKEVRTAVSLLIVLSCFTLCWVPIHIMHCVKLSCPDCAIPAPAMLSLVLLSHINSVINPIIYVFRMKTFWEAFKEVFSWVPTIFAKCSSSTGIIKTKSPENRNNPLPGMSHR